jgi:hypothetical protein
MEMEMTERCDYSTAWYADSQPRRYNRWMGINGRIQESRCGLVETETQRETEIEWGFGKVETWSFEMANEICCKQSRGL